MSRSGPHYTSGQVILYPSIPLLSTNLATTIFDTACSVSIRHRIRYRRDPCTGCGWSGRVIGKREETVHSTRPTVAFHACMVVLLAVVCT